MKIDTQLLKFQTLVKNLKKKWQEILPTSAQLRYMGSLEDEKVYEVAG